MKTVPFVMGILALCLAPMRADDVPEFPGESARLTRRFEELARKEAEARTEGTEELWRDVLDEIQALLSAHGNELVTVEKQRAVQVRRVCQERLSRLPSEALRLYRKRWDAQAEKWLDEGRKSRDTRHLRRVVDDAFATEAARDALERLGDLAFEQGRFEDAVSWWRFLALPSDASKDEERLALLHPARASLEASARARQLLARWFSGKVNREEWEQSLLHFKKRHPDSKGLLAGESDLYWKRLQEVASKETPTEDRAEVSWPTLGGADRRTRVLPSGLLDAEALGQLLQDGKHHSFPLGDGVGGKNVTPLAVQTPSEAARALSYVPVVSGGKVFLADARKVRVFDPLTGKADVWFDLASLGGPKVAERAPPLEARYGLTATEQCVLARLGLDSVGPEVGEKDGNNEKVSHLICLNVKPNEKGERLRWRASFGSPKEREIVEGSPVVDRERVYVAVTRFSGQRVTTSVYCFPLHAENVATPLWKRDVCVSLNPGSESRVRHHLLTRGGPLLFYCTHDGAVVALEADSGRLLWGVRYLPEQLAEAAVRLPAARDVNPCVYLDGRLYVAPADADILLCLDAATGRTLWERDHLEVLHLLGVAHGRVFFTTRTPSPGFRALNALDGGDRGGWFRTHSGGAAHPYGRGLLAGDLIIWPMLEHVYLLQQEDGALAADPSLTSRLPPGNLAFGAGTLVVAGREKLHLFVPALSKRESSKIQDEAIPTKR